MGIAALASFFVNRAFRTGVFLLMVAGRKMAPRRPPAWSSWTDRVRRQGLLFPSLMAPRWNPHSLSASIGPFAVAGTVRIEAQHLPQAGNWTAILYDRRLRSVAVFSPGQERSGWEAAVAPGKYLLSFRYYGTGEDLETPAVRVDGNRLADGVTFAGERRRYDDFLAGIKGKRPGFYWLLQYYAFYLLNNRGWVSAGLVVKHFLPVGNPDTLFIYGPFKACRPLQVTCRAALLSEAAVFICIYNEASFPERWEQLGSERSRLDAISRPGAYLVRVVPHPGCSFTRAAAEGMVTVSQPTG